MIRALRSEIVKLRQPTYLIGIGAMVAFMVIAMIISVANPGETTSDRGPAGLVLSRTELEAADGLARSLGNAVTFLGILVIAIVAVNVAGEYRLGTIRNLIVRQPRRGRLFLGKAATLAGYLLVAVAVTVLVTAPLAHLLASNASVDTDRWWTTDGIAALAGGVANLTVAIWGWAASGLLVAVVLRSASATIGVGVAYALPVEILIGELAPDVVRWLPGQLLQTLARGGSPHTDHTMALAGTLAWMLITTLLALIIFHHRDIDD